MGIALFSTHPGAVRLSGFADTLDVKLTLRYGSWAIFGKVAISNSDRGGDQNAQVLLRTAGGVLLDTTAVRIKEDGCADSITVQGTLNAKAEEDRHIEMLCATHDGWANHGSLIAIEVDTAYHPQD